MQNANTPTTTDEMTLEQLFAASYAIPDHRTADERAGIDEDLLEAQAELAELIGYVGLE